MLRNCCFAMAVALAPAATSWGELAHQYTFNDGNVNDSIGGQHGTVVNPMGVQAFSGGHLDLRANNAEMNGNISSNQTPPDTTDFTNFDTGLYADLPDFMISIAGSGGVISFETWATVETNRTWSRIFDFGTSNEGADTAVAADAEFVDYIFLTATSGGGNVEFTTRSPVGTANPRDGFATGVPSPPPGGQHHYVGVLDQTDLTEGDDGTLYLYVDGNLIDSGPVADGFLLSSMTDVNNWLGRSQWADPLFDGAYNEFRIYDHALSAQEVADSFDAGPEAVNPRFIVNREDQTVTLVSRGLDGDLAGYSLTSASSALEGDTWTPISGRLDDGTFDDAVWSVDAQTVDELAEAATSGTGGAINDATSISLGNLWVPSPNEDLVARVQLADGSIVGGEVVFEGNGGDPFDRSDLNFDGVVDADDWPIFVGGLLGDFSELGGARAYGMGDLDGDLDNDVVDFRLFKADFDAANGAGAFAALTGVPEPSTISLALLAAAALSVVGIRSRRRRIHVRGMSFLRPGMAALFVLFALTTISWGDMVHRWSFNDLGGTTVADSIGGAHGQLLGAGGSIVGGQVNLPGGASGTAAYVDLPNGIVSSLTDATFEGWAVVDGAQSWGRLFDFGSSLVEGVGGEVIGPGGGGEGQDYLQYAASRGTDINLQRLGFRNLDPAFGGADAGDVNGTEQLLDTGIPTVMGEPFHYAIVFESAADVMREYRNGQFIAEAPVTFELGNLNDVNNWLGRSNWTNDANFQGSFEEFRIYDEALDDQAIMTSFEDGPDVGSSGPPVLELEVNTVTGAMTIHNRQMGPIDFDFYAIESPGGALNVGGWNSLSEQETDAVGPGIGESWDEGGLADEFEIGEAYLLGMSVLDPESSISLGSAFNPSVMGAGQDGDLTFRYSSADGFTLGGLVTYTDEGDPGIPGDYSGNGLVEQADLDLVLGNWGADANDVPATWENDPPMGFVDQNELDKVLGNWGSQAPGLGAAAGVPEPSTAAIAALALCLATCGIAARRLR